MNNGPRSAVLHSLKSWPMFFDSVKDGTKTFELRKLDRDYHVGDMLELREWDPIQAHHGDTLVTKGYTGRVLVVGPITHILAGGFGLIDGYGILGFHPYQS